jgi:hypothetical protein
MFSDWGSSYGGEGPLERFFARPTEQWTKPEPDASRITAYAEKDATENSISDRRGIVRGSSAPDACGKLSYGQEDARSAFVCACYWQ